MTITRFYLNESEAAQFLGMAAGTLRNWRHLGTGPEFERVRRSVRYRLQALEAWVTRDHGSSLAPVAPALQFPLRDGLPAQVWEHIRDEALARGMTPADVIADHVADSLALRILRWQPGTNYARRNGHGD